ncbi:RNA polymerase sigma factor [Pseudidiomarina sp. PP-1MA]|uniref:RNA polymerase sigma factor n=1 Tax=Pseudidiomarina sp. PP-1MA TaxID=3237706 RepID=A0AB39XAR1_9GAMM
MSEDLVKSYWPRMVRAASGYEANPALRDELAQEMAFAVWRGLAQFQGESSVNTYIYRIIHNVAVDHIRRASRQPQTEQQDDLVADHQCPEHLLTHAQQHSQLLAAVQQLPMSLRQVMLLKLEDLSNIEIGETLGLSESNVGVRLNRGKQQLTELMRKGSV